MNMTTNIRKPCGVALVDIRSRIELGEESAVLCDLVRDLSKGQKQILFNLGNVKCIESPGLGHLASAFMSVRNRRGELKQPSHSNDFQNLMQIARLYPVFEIMDNEVAAIQSFRQSAVATG